MLKLAIFDFDGTIFPKDTLPFLLKQWYRLHYPRLPLIKVTIPLIPLYLQYKTGIGAMNAEQLRESALINFNRIFTGMTGKEVFSFFNAAYNNARPYFKQSIILEIARAKRDGYKTVLLSGAYQVFLDNAAADLNIDFTFGTKFSHTGGSRSQNSLPLILSGRKKLSVLTEFFKHKEIDWSKCRAYADSYEDLALLDAVGSPFAVNPDPKLRTVAELNSWPILE